MKGKSRRKEVRKNRVEKKGRKNETKKLMKKEREREGQA